MRAYKGGLPDEDTKKVEGLADNCDPVAPESCCRVPANDPLLPTSFRVGQEMAIITDRGTLTLPIREFGVCTGASETHFLLVLDGSKTYAGHAGLALPRSRLREPMFLQTGPEGGIPRDWDRGWLRSVQRHLRVALTASERKGLGPLSMKSAHTMVMEGHFPGSRSVLVSVAQPKSEMDYVSTLFFVDRQGRHLQFVQRPTRTIVRLVPRYRLDIDGDGIDEVIVHSVYYEGDYLLLMRWNGEKFEFLTLTGDGA